MIASVRMAMPDCRAVDAAARVSSHQVTSLVAKPATAASAGCCLPLSSCPEVLASIVQPPETRLPGRPRSQAAKASAVR